MTLQGKTYSLYGQHTGTDQYYGVIRELTGLFLARCPDEKRLLAQIQRAGSNRSILSRRRGQKADRELISYIRHKLKEDLADYTAGVKNHLKTISLSQRFDRVISTKEYQYHLYMIEIELANRVYREAFHASHYKFSIIAHCLRDFRPACASVEGDYESVCKGCTEDCFINLGSALLSKYGIHPYISASMDLDRVLKKIKADHRNIGALGIACVPELALGMRLCTKLGIPAIGIPLDANRCARWMKEAHESSFNMKELERILQL